MRRRINRLLGIVLCVLCCTIFLSGDVVAQEEKVALSSLTISDEDQEYGMLYGSQYSDTDDSQWLTLKLSGRGLRIINEDNKDLVLVDQFGSVYVNGQLCNPEQGEKNDIVETDFTYGFMYFLVILSLLLGCYNFIARKKN